MVWFSGVEFDVVYEWLSVWMVCWHLCDVAEMDVMYGDEGSGWRIGRYFKVCKEVVLWEWGMADVGVYVGGQGTSNVAGKYARRVGVRLVLVYVRWGCGVGSGSLVGFVL